MTEEYKNEDPSGPVERTVNINGIDYLVDTLPDNVKALISVYEVWQNDLSMANKDLNDAKLSIAKNEAALRDLVKEINENLDKHNANLVEAPPETVVS